MENNQLGTVFMALVIIISLYYGIIMWYLSKVYDKINELLEDKEKDKKL